MTSGVRLSISVFRVAYGAFYLAVGLYGGFSLLAGRGNPFTVEAGPGADFQDALQATGFIIPLMLTCYVIGGAALLFNRTAPLGIIVLAPFVVVIFSYHVLLGGSVWWAVLWATGLMLLAWRYRDAFVPLVNFTDRGADASAKVR